MTVSIYACPKGTTDNILYTSSAGIDLLWMFKEWAGGHIWAFSLRLHVRIITSWLHITSLRMWLILKINACKFWLYCWHFWLQKLWLLLWIKLFENFKISTHLIFIKSEASWNCKSQVTYRGLAVVMKMRLSASKRYSWQKC